MEGSESMSEYPDSVVDVDGHIYELPEDTLGKGGQGVVFSAKNTPDVAVKFCEPPGARGAAERKDLQQRLERVQTLPLAPEFDLARPLSMLRGHTGYTMRLLDGMVPIGQLIGTGVENVAEFYAETGGLRRRLEILARAARILARLHAQPLVYADISHQNIFVSKSTDAAEVWFIDADNLVYEPDVRGAIHTPYFGAPEVVRGESPVHTLTDIYSFAVLAFWVLAQNHPFLGEAVEVAGWDVSTTEDLEEKARRGELPYVDDPDNPRNRALEGIPRDIVMTATMRRLFEQMFVAGRIDPFARPGAADFVEALRQARDMTLTCGGCGMTYFVNAGQCPWCDAEAGGPAILSVEVRRWDPRLDEDDWEGLYGSRILWRKVIEAGRVGALRRHEVSAAPLAAEGRAELEVEIVENGVRLERAGECEREFWVVSGAESTPRPIEESLMMPLPIPGREWHLHCGPLEQPHRLASFRYVEGQGGR